MGAPAKRQKQMAVKFERERARKEAKRRKKVPADQAAGRKSSTRSQIASSDRAIHSDRSKL